MSSHINIDVAYDAGTLSRFWRATGFANPEALFEPTCRRQLEMAASIPNRGIEHVRIHRLLNLVGMSDLMQSRRSFEWDRLDQALDFLIDLGLKPFFELMGNPSERFDDFSDPNQLRAWRGLIAELSRHLTERYGEDEIASWYFETWNEPDCRTWWPQFVDNPSALCSYFDACAAGLRSVSDRYRLGGPGGQGNLNAVTKAFLEHCDHGTDYFTGGAVARLDFISAHEKAAPFTSEDIDPDFDGVIEREHAFIRFIREHCPSLVDVPYMNNEADPQIGWNGHHSWHATCYYPAFAARLIDRHLIDFIDHGISVSMVLNDNGFVGTWGQRTLTTCIESPADEAPPAFELFPKPIFHLMTMLSRLGPRRCAVDVCSPSAAVGAIAAVSDDATSIGRVVVICYNHADELDNRSREPITVSLQGLPFEHAVLRQESLIDTPWQAFTLWSRMGAPSTLTAEQADLLRKSAAAPDTEPPRPLVARRGIIELEVDLPRPGVTLLSLTPSQDALPDAIRSLSVQRQPGVAGEILFVRWLPAADDVTYEYVVSLTSGDKDAVIIDVRRVSYACCYLSLSVSASCRVEVRGVDAWERLGPPATVSVP